MKSAIRLILLVRVGESDRTIVADDLLSSFEEGGWLEVR